MRERKGNGKRLDEWCGWGGGQGSQPEEEGAGCNRESRRRRENRRQGTGSTGGEEVVTEDGKGGCVSRVERGEGDWEGAVEAGNEGWPAEELNVEAQTSILSPLESEMSGSQLYAGRGDAG